MEPNEAAALPTDLHQRSHHHKKRDMDVGPRGMDPKVFKFVSGNVPPLNTRVRSTLPFVPNGSDPKAWEPSFSQQKHTHHHIKDPNSDINERSMDYDVHGFANG